MNDDKRKYIVEGLLIALELGIEDALLKPYYVDDRLREQQRMACELLHNIVGRTLVRVRSEWEAIAGV